MSDDEFNVLDMQERVIIRLRAALLALGKSVEEVDRIADDADATWESPPPPPVVRSTGRIVRTGVRPDLVLE